MHGAAGRGPEWDGLGSICWISIVVAHLDVGHVRHLRVLGQVEVLLGEQHTLWSEREI